MAFTDFPLETVVLNIALIQGILAFIIIPDSTITSPLFDFARSYTIPLGLCLGLPTKLSAGFTRLLQDVDPLPAPWSCAVAAAFAFVVIHCLIFLKEISRKTSEDEDVAGSFQPVHDQEYESEQLAPLGLCGEDIKLGLPGSWPSIESSSLEPKDDMLGAALGGSTYRFSSLGEILGFIFAPPYEEHLSSNVTQALVGEAYQRGLREGEAAGAAAAGIEIRNILELKNNQLEIVKREAKQSVETATEAIIARQAAKDEQIKFLKKKLRRFKQKRGTSKSTAGATSPSKKADTPGPEDMNREAVGGSVNVESSETTSAEQQSPCDAQPVNGTPGVKDEQQAKSSTSDPGASASVAQHSEAGPATSKTQECPAGTTSPHPDVPSRMKSVPEVQPATSEVPDPSTVTPMQQQPPSSDPIPPLEDLDDDLDGLDSGPRLPDPLLDALWRVRIKYNPGLVAVGGVECDDAKAIPISNTTGDARSDGSAPQRRDRIPHEQEHGSGEQANPASPDNSSTSPSAGEELSDVEMSNSDASTDPSSGEEDTFMSHTPPGNYAFIPQVPSPVLRGQSSRSKRSGRGDYPSNSKTNRILDHHPRLPHYSEPKHNFKQRQAITKRTRSPSNRKMVCDLPSHDVQQWLLDASNRMDYEYDSDLAWLEGLTTTSLKRSGLGGCRLASPRSSFW